MKANQVVFEMSKPVNAILMDEAENLAAQGDGALAQQDVFSKRHLSSREGEQLFYRACRCGSREMARRAVLLRGQP